MTRVSVSWCSGIRGRRLGGVGGGIEHRIGARVCSTASSDTSVAVLALAHMSMVARTVDGSEDLAMAERMRPPVVSEKDGARVWYGVCRSTLACGSRSHSLWGSRWISHQ